MLNYVNDYNHHYLTKITCYLKCTSQRITPVIVFASTSLWQKRKFLLFSVVHFSFFLPVFAQENLPITISGIVKDSSGNALAKASVSEKGTKNGTSKDAHGAFTLKVAGIKSVLVFSSIGFASQQVAVNTKSAIFVSMLRIKNDLDEVIVIGYGSRKKESLTGAISSVTAKDLDRVHGGSTVSSGLAGKIAGVTFRMPDGRPGAGANIQIRNMGDPLYVIDGIQQDAGQFNNLAPNDVESTTVLKDGSAAIFYMAFII